MILVNTRLPLMTKRMALALLTLTGGISTGIAFISYMKAYAGPTGAPIYTPDPFPLFWLLGSFVLTLICFWGYASSEPRRRVTIT